MERYVENEELEKLIAEDPTSITVNENPSNSGLILIFVTIIFLFCMLPVCIIIFSSYVRRMLRQINRTSNDTLEEQPSIQTQKHKPNKL